MAGRAARRQQPSVTSAPVWLAETSTIASLLAIWFEMTWSAPDAKVC